MSERQSLTTERDSIENMIKAFLTFKDSVTDQMETIRAAASVLYESMKGDAISQKYCQDLGKEYSALDQLKTSVDTVLRMLRSRLEKIDEMLAKL